MDEISFYYNSLRRRKILVMKKVFTVVFALVLCAALLVPVSAANWTNNTFTSGMDVEPDWYADAEVLELEDFFEEGATNARCGDYYVFLKNDGKGDFSVQFDVKEDGLYDIGITLMAWAKSVLRTTNVRIDDSDWVYIAFDYEDENKQLPQYLTGLQIELKKGTHTFTMSLASDFDDSTVKSLYFDNFFYAKAADPVETVAEVVETPETVAETSVDVVTNAPKTFDVGIIAAVGAIVSAAGYAVAKKH